MNALLEQIAAVAPDQLRDFITNGAHDIADDMGRAMSEAVLQETSPKFALIFKIQVNPDKNVFDCDLSWALRKHLTSSHQIEDPAQGKLPIEEASMTFEAAGIEPVTITAAQARKAIKTLDKLNANL